MSLTDLLCQAIEEMRIVEFHYKAALRSVEPHTLGFNKRGVLTLCAWQLTGGSGEAWRDFHVDLMADLALTDQTFHSPRDGYNPSDSTLTNIVCAL